MKRIDLISRRHKEQQEIILQPYLLKEVTPKERVGLLLNRAGKLWTKNVIETECLKPFAFHFHCRFRYILIKFGKVENSYLKFKLLNSLLPLDSRKFNTRMFRT